MMQRLEHILVNRSAKAAVFTQTSVVMSPNRLPSPEFTLHRVMNSDYRGEVSVVLIHHGSEDFTVTRGDRIAQLVIAPVSHARLSEVETLDETARGAGGYGSTGVSGGANAGGRP